MSGTDGLFAASDALKASARLRMLTTTTEPVLEPRVVIETPMPLTQEQVAALRDQFDAYPQMVVLPAGARLRTIGPDGQVSVDYEPAPASSGVPWWVVGLSLAIASIVSFLFGVAQ